MQASTKEVGNQTLPVRILIVDDYPLVREGLAAVLSNHSRIRVVAQAGGGREAIELFRQYIPDIVLMDVRMPDIDGISATETLCREFPDANVIMLALSNAAEDIYRALAAGAKAYVLKEGTSADLVETIYTVAAGNIAIAPGIAAKLTERMRHQELTPREKDVLAGMAAALNNNQIAERLFITEGTVKAHVNHILVKLQAHDRTGAVMTALKRGLIHLD
ncbi:MAG: two component transcriptional regulator, LuxR family [Chthonomonadaceae bacterium]|nr:two component transcriptional regulator, LuxR family [Chthonomonadaceae bacterium]